MKVSPLIFCLAVSVACHLGVYLGNGNQDSTVYQISMEESVSSIAVDIIPVREEVPEVVKAKPKPPKPEEPLLTTEENTETLVEKAPEVEEVVEEPEPVPDVVPLEEPPEVLPEEDIREDSIIEELPELEKVTDQQQKQVEVAAMSKESIGAFTQSYPVANLCPAPRYPLRAREKGIEGKVILRVTVNSVGRVEKIKIQRSSGHKELDGCAVRTVRKHWVFEPARKGKKAVVSTVNVELMFHLNS